MIDIDLDSTAPELLLNPRLPSDERERLERIHRAVGDLPGHLWVTSSGSTGALKLVGLSKRAILASAAAVNEHLAASNRDVWCLPLPPFHVGGIGILARASLSGAKVCRLDRWDARAFAALVTSDRVTLSALVPAQLADLVTARLNAPDSMRAIVIGGGSTPPQLYADARRLGWPVLPSYGMTECCSQVATASLDSLERSEAPPLQVLGHLEVRLDDGLLAVRGSSLFTAYAIEDESGAPRLLDPKVDGWFRTEDRAVISERDGRTFLEPGGRSSDFLKIGGESVSLARLDEILASVLASFPGTDAAVFAVEDERLGQVVHLAVSESGAAETVLAELSRRVLPFERPRALHVAPIPRSPLGKVRRGELAKNVVREPSNGGPPSS